MLSTDSLMGALDPGTCGEPEQEVGDVSDMMSPESRTLSVFFPPHNLGPGLHGPFPCNTVPGYRADNPAHTEPLEDSDTRWDSLTLVP